MKRLGGIVVYSLFLILSYCALIFSVQILFGSHGLAGDFFTSYDNPLLFLFIYFCIFSHITITAMSLSFHRYHTHKGIIINPVIDHIFQLVLWLFTSMSKKDWVSVHIYHHAHSDKPKDPHSPVQKGLFRVMFGGAFDYNKAKKTPEVLKLRKMIKNNWFENFMGDNQLLGPIILTVIVCSLFGPVMGTIVAIGNMLISPVLAVGGVNAIAHHVGYKNHHSGDNSRNIGFLFPLNFIMCGELDHNNHHKYPRSCSFRHKWYEFDIGYFYIKILDKLNLVEVKNVYNTKKFKSELGVQIQKILEYDQRFKTKCNELALELNLSVEDFKSELSNYLEGQKNCLEAKSKEFLRELRKVAQVNIKLNLAY